MPAVCEWKVEKLDGSVRLEVTETWECSEFNERAGRDDFCTGEKGSHSWVFEAAQGARFEFLVETGDPPPERFYLESD
jgi:hypothetical protein